MKLGIQISEASVAKYMVRNPKPPSQTWRTFLDNHVAQHLSMTSSLSIPFGLKSSLSFLFLRTTIDALSILTSNRPQK